MFIDNVKIYAASLTRVSEISRNPARRQRQFLCLFVWVVSPFYSFEGDTFLRLKVGFLYVFHLVFLVGEPGKGTALFFLRFNFVHGNYKFVIYPLSIFLLRGIFKKNVL